MPPFSSPVASIQSANDVPLRPRSLNSCAAEQARTRRRARLQAAVSSLHCASAVPMRPDAWPDPAVETLEELSDVGAFVVLAPAPQEWIKFRNQLRGVQGSQPFGSLPNLIHETTDRLLLGIRIRRTLSGLTTNLTRRQMELPLSAFDFVAEELEAFSEREQSSSSADVTPRPVVSGFGQPPPLRLVPLLPIDR